MQQWTTMYAQHLQLHHHHHHLIPGIKYTCSFKYTCGSQAGAAFTHLLDIIGSVPMADALHVMK
jgi:hypothetical protein